MANRCGLATRDVRRLDRAEPGRVLADLIGHVGRLQMRIKMFDHSGVAMAERLGDDHQRHASHDAQRGP